jgi:hypothetical protein
MARPPEGGRVASVPCRVFAHAVRCGKPGASMSQRAEGTFEVSITGQVQPPEERALLARNTLAKVFRGDLEGTGSGVMLAMNTAVENSAVYVALEVVRGRLDGKEGTFGLQHVGVMERGDAKLSIRIVPDSGTGELAGITGTLGIRIEDGVHYYTLDYLL